MRRAIPSLAYSCVSFCALSSSSSIAWHRTRYWTWAAERVALAQYLIEHADRQPRRFVASDVDTSRLSGAFAPTITFLEASVYGLPFEDRQFELVVCCEVLEHLKEPEAGFAELCSVGEAVLVSVPWEPVWRLLNVLRGQYLSHFGNTPGHVQHFRRRGLRRLTRGRARILAERRPFLGR